MTTTDLMTLLKEKIAESSQSKVAAALGVSSAALSQIMSGTYKAAPDNILQRVREIYGGETVNCPELGEITLAECSCHRKRQPTTDSFYARMYRACQKCGNNK